MRNSLAFEFMGGKVELKVMVSLLMNTKGLNAGRPESTARRYLLVNGLSLQAGLSKKK